MQELKKGDSVIAFRTKDIEGNTVNLDEHSGQRVYLAFFRKASCPFCNMGLRDLINSHSEFEAKGIKVIALFSSSKEEIMKHAGNQKAPFPIIPDEKYEIYRKYGVSSSSKGMLRTMFNPKKVFKAMTGGFFSIKSTFQAPVLPADFLINETQEIAKAHYGKTYDDHLSVPSILSWEIQS